MAEYQEGQTATRADGSKLVYQQGVWRSVTKPQAQDASMRSRMDLGLGPMVQAQQDMASVEAKGNPYSMTEHPRAAVAKAMSETGLNTPLTGAFYPLDGIAKHIGGQEFQDYQQAAKAFEAQLMPIMSGAAVTPSEAQRQIKAALPELGDSPETLALKSRTRQEMLNGAAKARQLPLPYPQVKTWGVNTLEPPPSATPAAHNDPLGIRSR
jgi:hypothetical protein